MFRNRIDLHRVAVTAAAAFAVVGMCGASFAQVTGTIKLDGKAPEMKAIDMSGVKECNDQHPDPVTEETIVSEGGMLANVVVSIKTDDPGSLGGKAPTETIVLDQKGCQYSPHVMAVMVGQKMAVKNDDPTLHNVHSLAQSNPAFNFAQPNKDPGKPVPDPMKTAEKFKVKCDVHPWMSAYVAVFEHPFYAVSDAKGKFSLPAGLPDGDYDVEAWHESLGTKMGKVTVKGGKGTVDFAFQAEGAMGPMPQMDHTAMVSTTAGAAKACCTVDAKTGVMTMVKIEKNSDGQIELKAEH